MSNKPTPTKLTLINAGKLDGYIKRKTLFKLYHNGKHGDKLGSEPLTRTEAHSILEELIRLRRIIGRLEGIDFDHGE